MAGKLIGVGVSIHTMREDPRYHFSCEFDLQFEPPPQMPLHEPSMKGLLFFPSDDAQTIAAARTAALKALVEMLRTAADQVEREYLD